ncbi:hypothetical protein LWT56_22305 [Enterobacter roggenkampii]|uniref:hypothetical protein n=1 Tax=Enterobacter roggenkampii TaxID=1812935 RepID=UPI001E37B885|nr:hypothetical protein [Enterobacter roggenkampii]MCE1977402.1 hypothetical protein [Enterobacter roggenkampii]
MTHKTTLLRTDDFVRNIHSRNPFDVIRADVVLDRMEKRAGKTCGAYYEIYEVSLLGMALDYLAKLPLKDRPVFMGAASMRGFMLTWAEEERAKQRHDDLMTEMDFESQIESGEY